MKIGILTQPLRTNYGGILQNFALQQILKKMGHTPITLDYDSYYSQLGWLMGEFKSKIRGTRHDVEFPKYQRAGQENLNRFIHDHIKKTRPYSGLPLRAFAKHADALIVGSDQVWRPKCNVPVDWLYEMFFRSATDLNIPKVAYGASFGSDVWEYTDEQTSSCREFVKQFRAVSVRESSGVSLCHEYLDVDAIWVLDPTMLLNADDYLKLFQDLHPYKRPTLFAYILDTSEEKIARIQSIAKQLGLEIFIKGANDDLDRSDSVESWLSWIKNADFVITDSFHGSVFSILFNRPFYVFADSWRGNARFKSLLALLNLTHRTIEESDNEVDLSNKIDWRAIEDIRQKCKLRSVEFLRDNL